MTLIESPSYLSEMIICIFVAIRAFPYPIVDIPCYILQIEMPRGITENFDTTYITDLKFELSRKSFPGDFIFGAAASANQV